MARVRALRITDASARSLARVRHMLRHCLVLLLHTTLCACSWPVASPLALRVSRQLVLHSISRQYKQLVLRKALRKILDTRGALLASSASLACRSAALSTSHKIRDASTSETSLHCSLFIFGTPALGSQVLRTAQLKWPDRWVQTPDGTSCYTKPRVLLCQSGRCSRKNACLEPHRSSEASRYVSNQLQQRPALALPTRNSTSDNIPKEDKHATRGSRLEAKEAQAQRKGTQRRHHE